MQPLVYPIPTFGTACARVISFGCAFAQLVQAAQFPVCEINRWHKSFEPHTKHKKFLGDSNRELRYFVGNLKLDHLCIIYALVMEFF